LDRRPVISGPVARRSEVEDVVEDVIATPGLLSNLGPRRTQRRFNSARAAFRRRTPRAQSLPVLRRTVRRVTARLVPNIVEYARTRGRRVGRPCRVWIGTAGGRAKGPVARWATVRVARDGDDHRRRHPRERRPHAATPKRCGHPHNDRLDLRRASTVTRGAALLHGIREPNVRVAGIAMPAAWRSSAMRPLSLH
jgi:hypothetical protein